MTEFSEHLEKGRIRRVKHLELHSSTIHFWKKSLTRKSKFTHFATTGMILHEQSFRKVYKHKKVLGP